MITTIIFDCFGVLTDDLWKEFVLSLPESQRREARRLNHQLDSGNLAHHEFYQAIHQLTGRQPEAVEDIITSDMQKNVALFHYIEELSQNYTLGILSNISTDWVTTTFLTPREAALFTDMVFSYDIEVTKPDRRAYIITAERLNAQPDECVFIDDSPVNCEGAEAVGMKAIAYDNFTHFKQRLESILATNSND